MRLTLPGLCKLLGWEWKGEGVDGGGSGGGEWKGEGVNGNCQQAMLPPKHKLLGTLLPENLGFIVTKVFWRDGKGEGKSQALEKRTSWNEAKALGTRLVNVLYQKPVLGSFCQLCIP